MSLLIHILSDKGQEEYFTPKEVAEALRVRRGTVSRWCAENNINSIKKDRRFWIKGSWVRDFLLSRKTDGFQSMSEIMKGYKLPAQKNETK